MCNRMGMKKPEGRGDTLFPRKIAACRKCDRLVAYCASFQQPENQKVPGSDYWAKPVPGFGDRNARLLIIGLAPGAHGANRTGRPFTGDGAGEVLYRALYRQGFSNRESVEDRQDGLLLNGVYITNAVKCVPPKNRPSGEEKQRCLPWLVDELDALKEVGVVLAMGKDAHDAYLRYLKERGVIQTVGGFRFGHGRVFRFEKDRRILVATYHFSRYNINTRVLTEEMVAALFAKLKKLL